MKETERNQIKGALLKCAEENENQFTLTGHIVISSLCKSAVERIAELEKENAELKAFKQDCIKLTEDNVVMTKQRGETVIQLTKAKELIDKLEKENAELKERVENRNCSSCRRSKTGCPNDGSCHNFSLWQPVINPELTKANEWHYVKDGIMPAENQWVLVYDGSYTVCNYHSNTPIKWLDNYENEVYEGAIIAWKEIVPPKGDKRK